MLPCKVPVAVLPTADEDAHDRHVRAVVPGWVGHARGRPGLHGAFSIERCLRLGAAFPARVAGAEITGAGVVYSPAGDIVLNLRIPVARDRGGEAVGHGGQSC